MIHDLVEGQYSKPLRIIAFNTAEGWSRDVTLEIADDLRQRCGGFGEMSASVLELLKANRRSALSGMPGRRALWERGGRPIPLEITSALQAAVPVRRRNLPEIILGSHDIIQKHVAARCRYRTHAR